MYCGGLGGGGGTYLDHYHGGVYLLTPSWPAVAQDPISRPKKKRKTVVGTALHAILTRREENISYCSSAATLTSFFMLLHAG